MTKLQVQMLLVAGFLFGAAIAATTTTKKPVLHKDPPRNLGFPPAIMTDPTQEPVQPMIMTDPTQEPVQPMIMTDPTQELAQPMLMTDPTPKPVLHKDPPPKVKPILMTDPTPKPVLHKDPRPKVQPILMTDPTPKPVLHIDPPPKVFPPIIDPRPVPLQKLTIAHGTSGTIVCKQVGMDRQVITVQSALFSPGSKELSTCKEFDVKGTLSDLCDQQQTCTHTARDPMLLFTGPRTCASPRPLQISYVCTAANPMLLTPGRGTNMTRHG